MRAVVITRWTQPDILQASEAPPPDMGAGDVRIRVRAAPVSHALGLLVQGKYQRKPPFPFVPGNTVVGEIVETGTAAGRGLERGQTVLASVEYGGLAQEVVAPAINVYPLPETVDHGQATALNTSYNSVYAALTWPHLLNLAAGQTVLIHGASGNAGSAAVEVARELGVRVIATASTAERRERAARLGAAAVLPSDPDGLRDGVFEAAGGPVDAVLDPVGGDLFTQSIRCLRPEGRIVPLGFASGSIPQVAANHIMVKNIAVCGLYMGYYKIDARERFEPQVRRIFATLGTWLAAGRICPIVKARFPLESVAQAFASVADRSSPGHVVVIP